MRRPGRPRPHDPVVRWPSDDEVWYSDHSWNEWGEMLGVSPWTVAEAMRARGWRRAQGGYVVEAPCRECGRTYDVDGYTLRLCEECRGDPSEILKKLEAGVPLTLTEERALSLWRQAERRKVQSGEEVA